MAQRQARRIGLIALVAMVAFGPGAVSWLGMRWQQHRVAQQLQRLQARHEELLKTHQRLTTDAVYVEDLVRSTFKVAKPDELVVPLDDEKKSTE